MADETYRPLGNHPMPTGLAERAVYSGSGAPTQSPVPTSALYLDTDTGDFYEFDGTTWNLISSGGGGGGGSTEVWKLAGSSTPSATPASGGVAYNAAGDVWVYTSAGWTKVIAA